MRATPVVRAFLGAFACALLGALALAGPASAARLPAPQPSELFHGGRTTIPFRDTIVRKKKLLARTAKARIAASGGTYTTNTGEQVTVFLSDAFVPNDVANQAVANYVASLVHGSELGELTVYVAAPAEIAPICGSDLALVCYSDQLNTMAVNGNPGPGEALEETIAHEYGHHVANHRDNDPWPAQEWGPKRWATYEGICPRYDSGEVFPGDEGEHYSLNPGEGFAQAYAVLNVGPAWSDAFDRSFFPDQSSLGAIRSDVLDPWTANGYFTKRGRFRGRRPRSRYFTLRTPLDGRMKISLRSPRHADFDLYVYYRNRLVAKARTRRRTDTIRGVNCGASKFRVEVYRYRGRGRFSLQTTVP